MPLVERFVKAVHTRGQITFFIQNIACVAGVRRGGRREVRARSASEGEREARSFGFGKGNACLGAIVFFIPPPN